MSVKNKEPIWYSGRLGGETILVKAKSKTEANELIKENESYSDFEQEDKVWFNGQLSSLKVLDMDTLDFGDSYLVALASSNYLSYIKEPEGKKIDPIKWVSARGMQVIHGSQLDEMKAFKHNQEIVDAHQDFVDMCRGVVVDAAVGKIAKPYVSHKQDWNRLNEAIKKSEED